MSHQPHFAALKPKQQLFVAEYLVDLCAGNAAIRAGYAKSSAHVTASRLLDRRDIQEAVQVALSERFSVTKLSIIEELAAIALSDIGDYVSWTNDDVRIRPSSELSEWQRKAVASVRQTDGRYGRSIEVKLADKLKAIELLARVLGLLGRRNADDYPRRQVEFVIETSSGRQPLGERTP